MVAFTDWSALFCTILVDPSVQKAMHLHKHDGHYKLMDGIHDY